MIEYRDVHKAFDVPVLSGVSFTVESGETLAILGRDQAGIVVGVDPPASLVRRHREDGVRTGERGLDPAQIVLLATRAAANCRHGVGDLAAKRRYVPAIS
jgi:ABC-type glutathione transport system ATPase component